MPDTAYSMADPRLAALLLGLPRLGVPVLPADYDRCALVLPPGRGLDAAVFADTLTALLAKDADQRRILRRELQGLFPPEPLDPAPGEPQGPTAPSPVHPTPDPAPVPGSGATPPTVGLLIGRPEHPRPRALAPALLALMVLLVMPGDVGQRPAPPPPPEQPPIIDPPPPAAGALPEHPIHSFNTWVPILTATPLSPPRPWSALLLALAAALGGGWLWRRARQLRDPPAAPERYRYRPDGPKVLTWSAADRGLPDLRRLLGRGQRRELIWGVRHYLAAHPSPQLDAGATVTASARAGRPAIRFEPLRRLREVWLWRDTALAGPEPAALIQTLDHDLVRAGLRVRHGAFSAVPDPLWLDRRPARPLRANPLDLGSDAHSALVVVLTDGRGLAAALRGGGAPAARVHRVLRELAAWPRCVLVDCADDTLDLPALATRYRLACLPPGRLPAWLAERPDTGRAPPHRPAVPGADLRFWAACCALPALPVTAAQARALHDLLGLPPAWRLPDPGSGRGWDGSDGPRLSAAERRGLLCELADQVRADRGRAPTGARRRLERVLDFWQRHCDDLAAAADHLLPVIGAGEPRPWSDGPAAHRLGSERRLLDLWRDPGDRDAHHQPVLALAVADLHDRWRFYEQQGLTKARDALCERLAELSAADLGEPADDRIHLPWTTVALRERRGEPRGTALSRLYLMGFAGAKRAPGRRPRLGFEVRLALGLLAGAALWAGVRILIPAHPTLAPMAEPLADRLDAAARTAFRAQTLVTQDGGQVHAASRKIAAAAAPLRPGERLTLHWCWSGAAPAAAAPDPCARLWAATADPRRLNLAPAGPPDAPNRTMLLHAGTLAEPIRACAPDWPDLVVAVIAADPWQYPAADNSAARQLAIQLLDSGAADLAVIGPDWAAAARTLAARWSFVADSQWLYFTPLSAGTAPSQDPPPLGAHRALIHANYAGLADHLRTRVQGLLDPAERPDPAVANIRVLAGTPRLWGGPERETIRLADGTAMDFLTLCPGTFTMGADGLVERRLPTLVAAALGVDAATLTPTTRVAIGTLGEEQNTRLRQTLEQGLGVTLDDADWQAVGDLQAAGAAFKKAIEWPDEGPAHPVLLNAFVLARTETTAAQHAALTATAAPTADRARLPAAIDDWDTAVRTCQGLPGSDLPSEAQWEYAARAGSRTAWSWGDEAAAAGDYAWFSSNSESQAHPVDSRRPNPLGFADLHGNLWEWTRDCWSDSAYQERAGQPRADPLEDSEECRLRVARGGSFLYEPWFLRSAYRPWRAPSVRRGNFGFRCVRSPPRSLESLSP